MKHMKKLLALLLAVVMCVGVLSACAPSADDPSNTDPSATNDPSTNEPKVLVAASNHFEGKFSPFFAASAEDINVVNMTQISLVGLDRVADPLFNGIEGEKRTYNGTEYFYQSPSNIVVTENADGTVTYDVTIRDDMVFSDGVPVTIDDAIFSFYVYADPTYDGSTTIYSQPIKGMEEYRSGMATLINVIAGDGRDGYNGSEFYTQEQYDAFWAAFDAAGLKFVQEIVDYCVAAGANTAEDPISAVAPNWGYSLTEDATLEDFWQAIVDNYGYDLSNEGINLETAGTSITDLIVAELEAAGVDSAPYVAGVQTGESAPNISGIVKTGDYSMTITLTQVSANFIHNALAIHIAPMHYYGDESLYDYENNSFGFTKGDLSGVKSKTTQPLGAGPFVFQEFSNGRVYLNANDSYWEGRPKIDQLQFLETLESDKVVGIESGNIDIGDPSFEDSVRKQISEYNGAAEGEEILEGDVVTTRLYDFLGYAYVGINAKNVMVGDDPYSEASKNLRKAFATVLAVYRDESVNSYYGDTASVINYPISSTSWAAPQVTDDGYQVAYSVDVDGNPIYTDGMTAEERYAAALEAALGFFEAAGYTVANGKVTAAPEGARLDYQVNVGGNGAGNHPSFMMLTNTSAALKTIGINLQVNDIVQAADLYATYQSGEADMWAAAWGATPDPDMFQLYHTDGATNYYAISDAELDELIMQGRQSADQSFRKATYKAAMEIIMDYGVEVPVYQRSECYIFSTQRVNIDSLTPDMTPYWTWMSDIINLEVNG